MTISSCCWCPYRYILNCGTRPNTVLRVDLYLAHLLDLTQLGPLRYYFAVMVHINLALIVATKRFMELSILSSRVIEFWLFSDQKFIFTGMMCVFKREWNVVARTSNFYQRSTLWIWKSSTTRRPTPSCSVQISVATTWNCTSFSDTRVQKRSRLKRNTWQLTELIRSNISSQTSTRIFSHSKLKLTADLSCQLTRRSSRVGVSWTISSESEIRLIGFRKWIRMLFQKQIGSISLHVLNKTSRDKYLKNITLW